MIATLDFVAAAAASNGMTGGFGTVFRFEPGAMGAVIAPTLRVGAGGETTQAGRGGKLAAGGVGLTSSNSMRSLNFAPLTVVQETPPG